MINRRTPRGLNTAATVRLTPERVEITPYNLGRRVNLEVNPAAAQVAGMPVNAPIEGVLGNLREVRPDYRAKQAEEFMRAGALHDMATSTDLQANPITPRSLYDLQNIIDIRDYNDMGGAYAVLPQTAKDKLGMITQRLEPFLSDRGYELGRSGIGKGGQPFVSWKKSFDGDASGITEEITSILPQSNTRSQSYPAYPAIQGGGDILRGTIDLPAQDEFRSGGMTSKLYSQRGEVYPEVQMSGWQDKASAPQIVLNNRAGLVSVPGEYPVLQGKDRYMQPISMRQSFTSLENEMLNPTAGYRRNPESIMIDRQTGEVIPTSDLLQQDTPELVRQFDSSGKEIRQTWVDSADPANRQFFSKTDVMQSYPQGDLVDPTWKAPFAGIEEGSNQALPVGGSYPIRVHYPATFQGTPDLQTTIRTRVKKDENGNPLPTRLINIPFQPMGQLHQDVVMPARLRSVPSQEVEVVSTDVPFSDVASRQERIMGGAIPPAFQEARAIQPTRGYDITTENNPQAFKPSVWEQDIKVQLPSTVLADKRLSSYDLVLPSTVDSQSAKTFPGRLSIAEQRNLPETSREGMGDYVQAVRRGEGYDYIQPTVDAQDVLDRLGVAQRRANTGYANERDRVGRSIVGMTPQQASSSAIVINALDGDLSPDLRDKLTMARYKLSGIANPGRFNEELQGIIDDPGVSDALKAKLYGVQSQMGRQVKTNQQLNQLAAMQDNRDEYGRRVAFSENAIANAYNQLGTMPDVEMTRVTEMVPAPGGGIDTISETVPMSLSQRLNEARDFQQRGYGQLATSLPTENVAGQQVAQIKVGPENLNATYVFPHNKVMGGPQVVNMIRDGKVEPVEVQSKANYVVKEGSLVEVRPLNPQQQAQVDREIAAGQRSADPKYRPIGTTNPYLSMPNEFTDVEGLGMGQSQQLPVQLGKSPRVETEGIADMTTIQPRYDTTQEQRQRTAGQRLRSEAGGYTQGALSDAELARRTQALLQQKFGDNWRSYLVQ